ncbi:E3 ubiquitin-protein ligase RNF183 [Oryzias melastigma]|uniref:Ring finger protein 183 n=1 Tax=Oryzias melastigma TaxID=30732 RepID=A0A3B3CKL8_ORYME|nr:E3 ubiquitin-protein ligase RNF183 [Oryzias melastigma]
MNEGREPGRAPGGSNPPLAPNVKPKPNQNEKNTKEQHKTKERPVKVRRSRSTDSERGERGRRRERERERGSRGRSEDSRRRERRDGARRKKPPENDVEDTECSICFCSYDNIFKTPKLLACGHTFCLECLARINVTSTELKNLSCPVCREVTELPHGRDLPRLGNNQDIIQKLPSQMQRALSIRFQRSKGKLMLKRASSSKPSALSIPTKNPNPPATSTSLSEAEQGAAPTTVLNVGRPPNRTRGRLRRLFRSDQCYYAVVAIIITITVVILLVAILAFVIVPTVSIHSGTQRPGNHSSSIEVQDGD